jgi:hypothetical protein
MSIDLLLRAGTGIESRIIRRRASAGRWTHMGMLFEDGSVYACDAQRGVVQESFSAFAQSALDVQRIRLRIGKRHEKRLRKWCANRLGEAFDHTYPDWEMDRDITFGPDGYPSTGEWKGYYCTTFVLTGLRYLSSTEDRCSDHQQHLEDCIARVHAQAETLVIPFLGKRRLILPGFFAVTKR